MEVSQFNQTVPTFHKRCAHFSTKGCTNYPAILSWESRCFQPDFANSRISFAMFTPVGYSVKDDRPGYVASAAGYALVPRTALGCGFPLLAKPPGVRPPAGPPGMGDWVRTPKRVVWLPRPVGRVRRPPRPEQSRCPP